MEFQAKYRALATANALIACQTEAAVGIIKWEHTLATANALIACQTEAAVGIIKWEHTRVASNSVATSAVY